MLDIFVYVCQHVMNCVHINMDVSSFIFQPEIFALAPETNNFLMDYIFPLMHAKLKMEKFTKPCSDSMLCIAHRRLKFSVMEDVLEESRPFSPILYKIRNESVMMSLSRCQRIYHTLGRFVQICKARCAPVRNSQDLHLDDISEGDPNTYYIMHMGAKYVFRVNELRNTIMSCIENTDEFFPDILDIRNPYNNIAFSSCDLYNFYFFLKTHNYSIHPLLHGFFLSNFDVVRYVEDYEVLIRDKAINDHAMRGIVTVLYPTVSPSP